MSGPLDLPLGGERERRGVVLEQRGNEALRGGGWLRGDGRLVLCVVAASLGRDGNERIIRAPGRLQRQGSKTTQAARPLCPRQRGEGGEGVVVRG